MDEYTLVVWAALQADRRRLEREERNAAGQRAAVRPKRQRPSEFRPALSPWRVLQWR